MPGVKVGYNVGWIELRNWANACQAQGASRGWSEARFFSRRRWVHLRVHVCYADATAAVFSKGVANVQQWCIFLHFRVAAICYNTRQWCIADSAPTGTPFTMDSYSLGACRRLGHGATNTTQQGVIPATHDDAITPVAATVSTCLHMAQYVQIHVVIHKTVSQRRQRRTGRRP